MAPARGRAAILSAAALLALAAVAADAPADVGVGNTVEADLRDLAVHLPAALADPGRLDRLLGALSALDRAALRRLRDAVVSIGAETQQQCVEHLFLNRTARATECFVARHLLARSPQAVGVEEKHVTTLLKLGHDAEMMAHLEARGLLPVAFRGAPALYRSVLESARQRYADGWVVVDDALRPAALERLRAFLIDSTFYYTPKQGGQYLMAAFEDGLASPLILQLVDELRAAFPSVLGRHHLRMAWAFKYDNLWAGASVNGSDRGVPIHADAAAVNVNFWLVDLDGADFSDGEGEPQLGGLTLYQAEAPAGERFVTYNNGGDNPEIVALCAKSERSEVAYRPNRLVMFNSNLFHETQPLRVRRGFSKRRINLTLLFGDRCGKTTSEQL